jgi:hypothetical protein
MEFSHTLLNPLRVVCGPVREEGFACGLAGACLDPVEWCELSPLFYQDDQISCFPAPVGCGGICAR